MTADRQEVVEQTLQLADSAAQLFFSGPPHNLAGAIPLINTSSEKLKLRSVSLKSSSLMGAARLPPDSFGIMMSGLAAGKLPMASLGVALHERGTGLITSFHLDDPAWNDERDSEVSC